MGNEQVELVGREMIFVQEGEARDTQREANNDRHPKRSLNVNTRAKKMILYSLENANKPDSIGLRTAGRKQL